MLAVFPHLPETRGSGKCHSILPALAVLIDSLQFVSIKDKGNIGKVLRNWPRIEEARIAVVTDGMAILFLLTVIH